MKFIPIISAEGSAVMGSLLGFNVMAHALWLESDNAGARLYFGEYAENLCEISPGSGGIIDPIMESGEFERKAYTVESHKTTLTLYR